MPRKVNGMGSFKSSSMGAINNKISSGKVPTAFGSYPSNRSYGSTVTRSIIEQYNLDSDWCKWRRGMEYYYRGAYISFGSIDSKLYQGTPYEQDITFSGHKFATVNADSKNHYVAKREMINTTLLGTIQSIANDPDLYASYRAHQEIWVHINNVNPGIRMMLRERLTDGLTEATVVDVLDNNKKPAIYLGKSTEVDPTVVKVTVPLSEVQSCQVVQDNGGDVSVLTGEIGYIKTLYNERTITSQEFGDSAEFFTIKADESATSQEFEILDQTDLPPSIYDIASLTSLFSTVNADWNVKGTYSFKKDSYQRFFGDQYLTGDLVKDGVNQLSFNILPFTIRSLLVVGNTVEFTSIPMENEIKLYAPLSSAYVIFADYSFTKRELDLDEDGNDYHNVTSGENTWWRILTDVDPWMDEVFTTGLSLRAADIYCCSCPAYSKSILRMPEAEENDLGKKANRQQRYPMPSVQSKGSFEALGFNKAAGSMLTWQGDRDQVSFKMCKHTIASMFSDHLKIQEPNSYPTIDARESFELKLAADMDEVGREFQASIRRGELTTIEIVFALSQGLNLDEVEQADIVLSIKN